jgi:hypothetical protein
LHLIALVVFRHRQREDVAMSLQRWVGTTVVMCAVAWGLESLGPGLPELRAAVHDPQGLVDRSGADALLLVAVPCLAWLCWAWGALGLLLTAASTVPGSAGRLAGLVRDGVLPAGARRAAAVALGVGLSATAPALLPPAAPLAAATAAAADDAAAAGADHGSAGGSVLVDWPSTPAVPDWPAAPSPDAPSTPALPTTDWPSYTEGDHVVVRGDCLWDIAADWVRNGEPGPAPSDVAVQRAVQAWWQTNAAVIGPDPDLLLPGQVLRPPG